MTPARLSKAAWLVVAYCVAVILWGSVVRATGSGAGCGGHWPTCDGAVLIIPTSTAMWFELAHRASSGLLLVLVKMLIVATFRTLPAGHPARRSVAVAGGILVVEALLGAGLVLFGLVADNDSLARAVVIAIHLTNTMALLAFLTLTALLAARRDWRTVSLSRKEDGPTGGGWLGVALAVGLASLVVVGASGAVTALGDTLFPARTLGEALRDDASPTAHLLVRMRVLHPVVAIASSAFLLMLAGAVGRAVPRARRASAFVTLAVVTQVILGFVNLIMLAPVPLQVIHLLVADGLWIGLVVMAASAWLEPIGTAVEMAEASNEGQQALAARNQDKGLAGVRV